ncbi:MAG: hypothetical protein AAFQ87_04375 [Bacteroidota bacterium]
MSTNIKTQADLVSVKQFDCPSCGNGLSLKHPRAQYICCPYCGSVLDAKSEEHQILEQLGKPERQKPMSFIKLGQVGTLEGIDYQVLARTRWRMRYKEYYSEEGETGYSDEVWVFDEWLLISADRTYAYLVEDREGYWISEEIIPETPTLLTKNRRMSFYKKQSNQIVREYGQAEVIYFEGESNYRIKKGDKVNFAMFKERGISYSAEWRMVGNTKEIKEIEFFKETPLSRRKVLEAFADNEAVAQLKQSEGNWRYILRVIGATMLFLLLGLGYSFVSNGSEVYSNTFDPAQVSDQQPLTAGPIVLDEGALYNFQMKARKIGTNSEMYLFAYLLDADKQVINTLESEFFYYTGRDDEGTWVESSDESSQIFRMEQGGTYYLQVLRDGANAIPPGEVSIIVRKDIWLSRYFVFGLLFLLIPLAIAWNRSGAGK